jgi:uncharacterized protein YcbX
MSIVVRHLYRYPVKGLSAQPLAGVELAAGGGVPGDRRFALVRGDTKAANGWVPKERCVMLMRDAALARLRAVADGTGDGALELAAPDGRSLRASLDTSDGRGRIEAFVNAFLGARPEGPARLAEAGALSFTDVPQNCLSIIGLASVADLGSRMSATLDPLRFRANVYVDGAAPWEELGWIGREVTLGAVRVRVLARIPRCAATHVNPATGERDQNVVKALRAHYGHHDMGVYAEIVAGGRLGVGDPVRPFPGGAPGAAGRFARKAAFFGRQALIYLRARRG